MKRKKTAALSLIAVMLILTSVFLSGCGEAFNDKVNAVPIGTWIETKQTSERDGKRYPMKYRITSVDRDKTSVDKRIADYNASARGNTVEPLTSDKLEYAIADYEAYYPADFPDDEFGITAVAVKFTIAGLDGKAEISVDGTNYKGLTDTWEIGALPMGYDFYSDDTYKGSFVFVMAKGSDQYVFSEGYSEGGKEVVHYAEGK